ncbi:MAG: DsbA family protein [Actinobacteria bacterium]|nr:DsbA family protein [Actinomycetota bacterium]
MSEMEPFADPSIIYVGDPMCSWCWGIAPQIDELQMRCPDLPFHVVVGGLQVGPGAEHINDELAEFLAAHWMEVEAHSRQPFDLSILKRRDWLYDTEPACRAVAAMREIDEAKAWPLFKRLQRAFYAEGTPLSDSGAYPSLVADVGADPDVFMESYLSDASKEAAWADFGAVAEWGITGFPTVLVRRGSQGHLLANGYREAVDMHFILADALA